MKLSNFSEHKKIPFNFLIVTNLLQNIIKTNYSSSCFELIILREISARWTDAVWFIGVRPDREGALRDRAYG